MRHRRPCAQRFSFSAKYSLKSSVSRLPPMRPGLGVVDGFLYMRQENGRIGIEDFAIGEDIALSAIEEFSGGFWRYTERSRRSSTNPWTCFAASMRSPSTPMTCTSHCALRMRYPIAFSTTGFPGGRVFNIEFVYRNATLVRSGVKHMNWRYARSGDRTGA